MQAVLLRANLCTSSTSTSTRSGDISANRIGFPLVGGFVNGEIGPGRGGASRVGTHGYSTVLGILGNDRSRTAALPIYEASPQAAAGSAEDDRNFEFNFDPK